MRKATVDWLKSAEMDLANIAQIIHLEHLTPIAAFHAQQSVEKCFKAVLEEHSRKVPRDHSTLRLYGLMKELIELDLDTDMLTDLDDLYIESRYPGGGLGLLPNGKPSLADVKQFRDFAESIFEQVNRKVGNP